MATYNGSSYIRQQLDSILAQTYKNLEIVIFDDGSTDDTINILKDYAARFNIIRFHINEERKGYIKNFETAIMSCKGDVIFLCDQDDIWDHEKVYRHMIVHQNFDVAWIYNRVYLIDKAGARTGTLEEIESDYYHDKTMAQAAWGRCIIGCATSYKAETLKQIMPIGPNAKAHDSWFQLMLRGKRHVFIRDELQAYRIHESNTAAMKRPVTMADNMRLWHGHRLLLHDLVLDTRLDIFERISYFALYLRSIASSILRGR